MKNILILSFFLFAVSPVHILAQPVQKKTEVLILGTIHLQQLGNNFNPDMLEGVISTLENFCFDAICIEKMPGQLLYDIKSRNDSAFTEVLERFGGNRLNLANRYQMKFGIDYHTATENVESILSKDEITDLDRVELINNMLASTDLISAMLQYQYLADKTLLKDDNLKEELSVLTVSNNEIYSLAGKLALREGIQKLEYIDNFQDEAILMSRFPEFMNDYIANQDILSDIGNKFVYQTLTMKIEQGIADNDLMEVYSFLNSEDYMIQDVEAQWNIWLHTNFTSGTDRSRLYLWEMRNLQIAANIMHTASFYPGKKILVIIGSSHKAFLEKYLGQISDINLLEF